MDIQLLQRIRAVSRRWWKVLPPLLLWIAFQAFLFVHNQLSLKNAAVFGILAFAPFIFSWQHERDLQMLRQLDPHGYSRRSQFRLLPALSSLYRRFFK